MLRRRLFAEACAFAGEEIRNPDRLRMWIRYAHYFKYKTARSAAFSIISEGRSRGGICGNKCSMRKNRCSIRKLHYAEMGQCVRKRSIYINVVIFF